MEIKSFDSQESFNNHIASLKEGLDEGKWVTDSMETAEKSGRLYRILTAILRLFGIDLTHTKVDNVAKAAFRFTEENSRYLNSDNEKVVKEILKKIDSKTGNIYHDTVDMAIAAIGKEKLSIPTPTSAPATAPSISPTTAPPSVPTPPPPPPPSTSTTAPPQGKGAWDKLLKEIAGGRDLRSVDSEKEVASDGTGVPNSPHNFAEAAMRQRSKLRSIRKEIIAEVEEKALPEWAVKQRQKLNVGS